MPRFPCSFVGSACGVPAYHLHGISAARQAHQSRSPGRPRTASGGRTCGGTGAGGCGGVSASEQRRSSICRTPESRVIAPFLPIQSASVSAAEGFSRLARRYRRSASACTSAERAGQRPRPPCPRRTPVRPREVNVFQSQSDQLAGPRMPVSTNSRMIAASRRFSNVPPLHVDQRKLDQGVLAEHRDRLLRHGGRVLIRSILATAGSPPSSTSHENSVAAATGSAWRQWPVPRGRADRRGSARCVRGRSQPAWLRHPTLFEVAAQCAADVHMYAEDGARSGVPWLVGGSASPRGGRPGRPSRPVLPA